MPTVIDPTPQPASLPDGGAPQLTSTGRGPHCNARTAPGILGCFLVLSILGCTSTVGRHLDPFLARLARTTGLAVLVMESLG